MKAYKIKPVSTSSETLILYEKLLSTVFPKSAAISKDYLEWLYLKNPNGVVLGYDAWFGKELVAHYVCIPRKAFWAGKTHKILLSLNTATHTAHRNKGLFTMLAEKTYEKAKAQGFEAVIGVANANSTHGFLNKLEFKLITPLTIQFGFGDLNIKSTDILKTDCFRLIWTDKDLFWRLKCPRQKVFVKSREKTLSFFTLKYGRFFVPYSENPFIDMSEKIILEKNTGINFLHIFVGLIPKSAQKKNLFIKLIDRLKPAPLNFIFKNLTNLENLPSKENIFFTFLDFDVL